MLNIQKYQAIVRASASKPSDIRWKLIISTFFVVSNLCLPKYGFRPWGAEDFDILNNILFPISHANIFHLLCNIWCMWLMRPKYYLVSAVIISFLASFLPEPFIGEPIMGMSGILFAMLGAKYGRYAMGASIVKNMWWFFIITAFIPNVACLYHIYCIVLGYMWGWSKETYRVWSMMRTR